MNQAWISIASNIDPEIHIARALLLLAEKVSLMKISTFFRNPALDRPQDPDYLNGVVEITTRLSPRPIIESILHPIESALGRVRTSDRYASRTIDLDLIVYRFSSGANLDWSTPIEEIMERSFLSVPLFEIAPNLRMSIPTSELSLPLTQQSSRRLSPSQEFTAKIRKEFTSHES